MRTAAACSVERRTAARGTPTTWEARALTEYWLIVSTTIAVGTGQSGLTGEKSTMSDTLLLGAGFSKAISMIMATVAVTVAHNEGRELERMSQTLAPDSRHLCGVWRW